MREDLSGKTDIELIKNVKTDACSDSFNELLLRHENLFYKICHKYAASIKKCGSNIEEVLSEKMYLFFVSISSFDENKKSKFPTWLANQTRFHCLTKIFSNKNKFNVDNSETVDIIDSDFSFQKYNETQKKVNLNSMLELIKTSSDERIYYIFNRKYSDNKVKWKHIAEELGVTTQTVLNLHKKGILLLKKNIKSNKIEIYE